jgi:hypothetical protein
MTTMTAGSLDGTMLSVITFSGVHSRLASLLEDQRGRATWWVEVARQLDDLVDAVRSAPGDLIDPEGFTEQLRADAPHMMDRWIRLSQEGDGLHEAVTEVRMLVGEYAGDPTAIDAVRRAVSDVLAKVRRFQERTTEVLLDAYERDLGGE